MLFLSSIFPSIFLPFLLHLLFLYVSRLPLTYLSSLSSPLSMSFFHFSSLIHFRSLLSTISSRNGFYMLLYLFFPLLCLFFHVSSFIPFPSFFINFFLSSLFVSFSFLISLISSTVLSSFIFFICSASISCLSFLSYLLLLCFFHTFSFYLSSLPSSSIPVCSASISSLSSLSSPLSLLSFYVSSFIRIPSISLPSLLYSFLFSMCSASISPLSSLSSFFLPRPSSSFHELTLFRALSLLSFYRLYFSALYLRHVFPCCFPFALGGGVGKVRFPMFQLFRSVLSRLSVGIH